MPGRFERFDIALGWIKKLDIQHVICLCPDYEIEAISPEYSSFIEERGDLSRFKLIKLPIQNFCSPDDYTEFSNSIHNISDNLRSSKKILLHCSRGKGRTGTIAITILIELGIPKRDAYRMIKKLHAGPEREEQREFIDWYEKRIFLG